eukprot:3588715-Prymnesium_polylepis.2
MTRFRVYLCRIHAMHMDQCATVAAYPRRQLNLATQHTPPCGLARSRVLAACSFAARRAVPARERSSCVES